jgi:hypothetical protein
MVELALTKVNQRQCYQLKQRGLRFQDLGIDGHYSDSSYTQSTWDDSNGLYTILGVNHKFDANGNDATPISSLHSSSIMLDGRSG